MRFTERDARLLHWINGHGFVTVEQAAHWMGTTYQTGAHRIRVLVDGGYLRRERILHGDPRIHRVTEQGLLACEDTLVQLQSVNLGTYKHDLMLVDLAHSVVEATSGAFVPERRLRHQLGMNGARGHVPDGLLHLDGQKPIAVELELSIKAKDRVEAIVEDYAADRTLAAVWYFVTSQAVRRFLEKITTGYGLFEIHDWEAAR